MCVRGRRMMRGRVRHHGGGSSLVDGVQHCSLFIYCIYVGPLLSAKQPLESVAGYLLQPHEHSLCFALAHLLPSLTNTRTYLWLNFKQQRKLPA